jgi:hypothetical protein
MDTNRNRKKEPMPVYDPSYTVEEFCRAERMSVEQYYKLKKLGRGPREMRIGTLVTITHRDRLAWQDARRNPKGAEADEVKKQADRLSEHARRMGRNSAEAQA